MKKRRHMRDIYKKVSFDKCRQAKKYTTKLPPVPAIEDFWTSIASPKAHKGIEMN
jgi:hypothetical protein